MSPVLKHTSPYLSENEPIYEVIIKPSRTTIESLHLEKKDVPFKKVKALIDTGAQSTAISHEIVTELNLQPRGTIPVHTTAKTTEERNEYVVCLEFDTNAYIDTLRVIEGDLSKFSIDCLIGRDVLFVCTFIYQGPEKYYELSFGDKRKQEGKGTEQNK